MDFAPLGRRFAPVTSSFHATIELREPCRFPVAIRWPVDARDELRGKRQPLVLGEGVGRFNAASFPEGAPRQSTLFFLKGGFRQFHAPNVRRPSQSVSNLTTEFQLRIVGVTKKQGIPDHYCSRQREDNTKFRLGLAGDVATRE